MTTLICIPSRLGSTRLARKPLLHIHGRPLVAHVMDRAAECGKAVRVVVATDAPEIEAVVKAHGGTAVMTDPALPSGTDRVAAVARMDATLRDEDVVVNFQGDQPLLPGSAIGALLEAFGDPRVDMATIICPLPLEDLHNANVVKVVTNQHLDALYFSRATIPFVRDPHRAAGARFAAHVGVYAYRKRTLLTLAATAPCHLEEAEALEQLRALWMGVTIRCVPMRTPAPFEINTPEDHARAEALFARAGGDGAAAYALLASDASPRPTVPFIGA